MPNRVETFASNAMGKVKSAKGALQGLTGVFRTLMEEHGKVSVLLMRVRGTSDAEVRRELFPTIRRELLAHERGELGAVYPAFEAHPETAHMASTHAQGASGIQEAIHRLDTIPFDDPRWQMAFEELVERVTQHVKIEEESYFPTANRVLRGRAEELDRAYLRFKHNQGD